MKKQITVILILLFQTCPIHAETLKGNFTRGFETFEIQTTDKNKYFIEDPEGLIRKLEINKKNEKSFWASFPLCVEGKISKGEYGPSGKYRKKIRIYKICS